MSVKFKCKKCGSEELVFRCYAKCLIPVVIREGETIEYSEPIIDSDDDQNTGHYCCSECGSPVGDYLKTERKLLEYLSGTVGK